MSKQILGLAIAAGSVTVGLVAGCGDATADGSGDRSSGGDGSLAGRTFFSTVVTPPLQPGSQLLISFYDDMLGMHGGCNHFGGSYRAADGTLTFDVDSTTEMACAEPLMRQDERIARFLGADPTYELADDTLRLTGDGTTMELWDEDVAHRTLTGTEWVLDGIVSGSDQTGTVASVPAGVRSTLRFTSDDRLLVKLGCNDGGGEVTVTESTLEVTGFSRTLMGCGGARDRIERTVAGVLQDDADVGYVLDGDTLTLRLGATGLSYRAG